jgi:hypothetical protein
VWDESDGGLVFVTQWALRIILNIKLKSRCDLNRI